MLGEDMDPGDRWKENNPEVRRLTELVRDLDQQIEDARRELEKCWIAGPGGWLLSPDAARHIHEAQEILEP